MPWFDIKAYSMILIDKFGKGVDTLNGFIDGGCTQRPTFVSFVVADF